MDAIWEHNINWNESYMQFKITWLLFFKFFTSDIYLEVLVEQWFLLQTTRGFVKTLLSPILDLWLNRSGWDLRICLSSTFSANTHIGGTGRTLRELCDSVVEIELGLDGQESIFCCMNLSGGMQDIIKSVLMFLKTFNRWVTKYQTIDSFLHDAYPLENQPLMGLKKGKELLL